MWFRLLQFFTPYVLEKRFSFRDRVHFNCPMLVWWKAGDKTHCCSFLELWPWVEPTFSLGHNSYVFHQEPLICADAPNCYCRPRWRKREETPWWPGRTVRSVPGTLGMYLNLNLYLYFYVYLYFFLPIGRGEQSRVCQVRWLCIFIWTCICICMRTCNLDQGEQSRVYLNLYLNL